MKKFALKISWSTEMYISGCKKTIKLEFEYFLDAHSKILKPYKYLEKIP